MELRRKCKHNYALPVMDDLPGVHLEALYMRFLAMLGYFLLDISVICGIIRLTFIATLKEAQMARRRGEDRKERALRECGALNTHPVTDVLFREIDFFDSRDLVQVKYEMLRKVHKEAEPVSRAAALFGFSRPSLYKASREFEREGIPGLMPRKRGPRSRHKLTAEVLAFVQGRFSGGEPMGIPALLEEVEKHFGVRVHRRSLERALQQKGKKTLQVPEKTKAESL